MIKYKKFSFALTFFSFKLSNMCKGLTKREGGIVLRELFEQEYRKHEKSLFLVAVAYLHNTEDAKDVLQDAALSAYRSIDTLKNKEYFKTWLTRIVINKCKNFIKSRRYTEELTDNTNAFYNTNTDEMEIMDALCRMDPKQSIYTGRQYQCAVASLGFCFAYHTWLIPLSNHSTAYF